MSPSNKLLLPAFSWHPTLTPYRLAFIVITGGLGVSKALLVSRDQEVSSITVEWVAGVVVALSFQFLGTYEYKPHRAVYIDWVFSYDCLNIAKAFMHSSGPDDRSAGFARRNAVQHGASNASVTNSLPPISTAYRLLVSTSVSYFGLSKMACAYRGVLPAMNTLDWFTAVPLTLSLYYMGTFEEQESDSLRKFFHVDYSGAMKRAFNMGARLVVYLMAMTMCVLWIRYWAWILLLASHAYRPPKSQSMTTSKGKQHTLFLNAVKCVTMLLAFAMIQIGTAFSGVLLWPVFRAFNRRRAESVRRIGLLSFFILFYITSVSLCISLLMIFRVPDRNELPEWFIKDSYAALPVVWMIAFLMRYWQGFAIVLVFVVPRIATQFYNSYSLGY